MTRGLVLFLQLTDYGACAARQAKRFRWCIAEDSGMRALPCDVMISELPCPSFAGHADGLRRALIAAASGILAICAAAPPAAAATDERCKERIVIDPPVAEQKLRQVLTLDANDPKTDDGGADVSLELNIKLTGGKIYNPLTGQCDEVELRAYVDALAPRPTPKPPASRNGRISWPRRSGLIRARPSASS